MNTVFAAILLLTAALAVGSTVADKIGNSLASPINAALTQSR